MAPFVEESILSLALVEGCLCMHASLESRGRGSVGGHLEPLRHFGHHTDLSSLHLAVPWQMKDKIALPKPKLHPDAFSLTL